MVIVTILSYPRAPDELEDDHRKHVASRKRQWAATAEAEAEAARVALKGEIERTRASHSHEISKLEAILKDAKAQSKQAVAEAEDAKDAAKAERHELESILTGLRRQVVDEKRSLQEVQQTARKVAGAEALQEDEGLRSELMQVVSDLEEERKHVAELEGQLKEAKNGTAMPSLQTKDASSQTTALGPNVRDSEAIAKAGLLEDELALIVRENEKLRSQVSGVGSERDGAGMSACLAEAPKLERNDIADLKRDLKEAEIRLIEIQEAKDVAEQVTDSCVIMGHIPRATRHAKRAAGRHPTMMICAEMVAVVNKAPPNLAVVLLNYYYLTHASLPLVQEAKASAVALVDVQEKLAGLELDNLYLVTQVSIHLLYY